MGEERVRGCGVKAAIAAVVVVLVAVVVVVVVLSRGSDVATPGCTVTLPKEPGQQDATQYTLQPAQMSNAATIAAVASKEGLPSHAVTVALATALQESKLRNLSGGDRDSVGLFQQRPSQGWGTPEQLQDPVYAATAFYTKLAKLSGWESMPITQAAQAVQRSAAPDAYAQWEPVARAAASALTGQIPAALTCRNITVGPATADLVKTADAELGTARLSGAHPVAQGWAISTWLVARAATVGVDKVTFAGQAWTAESGAWTADPAVGQNLTLHQVPAAPPSSR
ncbi:hypothetical protein QRX50_27920 [Amycolatopsis carbonis]|uniref:Uncharacterized protein n=1 Tax=Amycolatopsis carbonis TaxID=715471 RepID=A0A9Y2IBC7_9PSEU|nr:hypothetical protein [Amycolatopsis sp. 2-15]WIX75348.1 hypothetical protein QRX50_27920 [Amycolatopsis sp. 2-15]